MDLGLLKIISSIKLMWKLVKKIIIQFFRTLEINQSFASIQWNFIQEKWPDTNKNIKPCDVSAALFPSTSSYLCGSLDNYNLGVNQQPMAVTTETDKGESIFKFRWYQFNGRLRAPENIPLDKRGEKWFLKNQNYFFQTMKSNHICKWPAKCLFFVF
jgi:hypothetical protein